MSWVKTGRVQFDTLPSLPTVPFPSLPQAGSGRASPGAMARAFDRLRSVNAVDDHAAAAELAATYARVDAARERGLGTGPVRPTEPLPGIVRAKFVPTTAFMGEHGGLYSTPIKRPPSACSDSPGSLSGIVAGKRTLTDSPSSVCGAAGSSRSSPIPLHRLSSTDPDTPSESRSKGAAGLSDITATASVGKKLIFGTL